MRKNADMRVTGWGARWNGGERRRVASVWIGVALVLGLSSGSALATAPGANGPIAFSSYGKIYTIQPDGSGLHPVVRADEEHKYDFYPSWSPDGQRIVTSGQMQNPDGYWTDMGLQLFSPDGTGFEHLPIFGYIGAPAWSPDGAHILFTRDGGLFSTTPDGTLPNLVESNAGSPAWSPDGSRIAFIRSVGPYEDTALYTVGAAGGDAQKLLGLPGRLVSPSWSPDGSTIAFTYMAREAREEPGPGELPYTYSGANVYAVPATGGEPVQLTESGTDEDPAWSPDGSTIVFQSDRLSVFPTSAPDLYLMNADGNNERRLTATIHCLQCGPDWASLPPHSRPPAPAAAQGAEPRRKQKFSRISMTRTRFAQSSRVWVRFRAAVAEKVRLTIRRAVPPGRAFRCGREPGACLLTGRDERRAREGFNRISLRGLLGGAPAPGRYWLQLSSSSGSARSGLAFRVMPPRDRRRRNRNHRQARRLPRASFHVCGDVPSVNSYDIEAKRVGCDQAKRIIRAYDAAVSEGGGFTKYVFGFHCKVVGLYGDGGIQRCAAKGHRVIRFLRGG
jgi:TolB protein